MLVAVRIAFFTAGTAGAGHLLRGLAIGRALSRGGLRATYRMFGPPQRFPAAPRGDWQDVAIAAEELLDPARAPESELASALRAFAPDVLVVDMFWAPLRHLLPLLRCEAWLLLRAMHPKWLVGPPGHPFSRKQYARVLAIEPALRADAVDEHIDPVVLVNPDEQRPVGALRERLGVPRDRRLVAVLHAGLQGEGRLLAPAVRHDETFVAFDLHDESALFPAAEWMRDCDALHAAAGYNTFWEAHWLGWAARTSFVPFARTNDDNHARMRCLGHVPRANGADTLAAMIMGRPSTPDWTSPGFQMERWHWS